MPVWKTAHACVLTLQKCISMSVGKYQMFVICFKPHQCICKKKKSSYTRMHKHAHSLHLDINLLTSYMRDWHERALEEAFVCFSRSTASFASLTCSCACCLTHIASANSWVNNYCCRLLMSGRSRWGKVSGHWSIRGITQTYIHDLGIYFMIRVNFNMLMRQVIGLSWALKQIVPGSLVPIGRVTLYSYYCAKQITRTAANSTPLATVQEHCWVT